MFDAITEWFFNLGANYGVNPLIFGAIYVGAIPFFSLSIAWLVKNYRRGRSIILPLLFAGFFFVSAYIYLIVAGKNVPLWVHVFLVLLIIFGVYSTIKKVRRQIEESENKFPS